MEAKLSQHTEANPRVAREQTLDVKQAKARSAGIKLATAAGAPKTAALIASKGACFQDIFDSAVREIGQGAFVKALQEAPRSWSRLALNMVPNLGAPGEALAASLAATADPRAAQYGDRISKFQLDQTGAISGIVRINQTGDYRNLFKNNTYDFNPADQGIAEGSTLLFYFGIEDDALIGLVPDNGTFIFDSTSPKIAFYQSWGIAGSQQFALQDHPG